LCGVERHGLPLLFGDDGEVGQPAVELGDGHGVDFAERFVQAVSQPELQEFG
jgi:hypothetical protein